MRYRVMKHGHKVGHRPLVYGETVTPQALRCTDAALEAFVARGVLRPVADSPAPKPSSGSKGE